MVVKRAAAGDDSAWDELVGHYGRMLRAVAAELRVQGCDAEDAAQTTWLALREDIHTIRDPEHVGEWLCSVMRRRCVRLLTQQRRERLVEHPDEWVAPEPAPRRAEPDGTLLWSFVDRLPDRERTVLRALYDGSDRNYRETAELLSMPVGSLGPVRMRALRRLSALLVDAGITAGELRKACRTNAGSCGTPRPRSGSGHGARAR